jgi:hypothetical protein
MWEKVYNLFTVIFTGLVLRAGTRIRSAVIWTIRGGSFWPVK